MSSLVEGLISKTITVKTAETAKTRRQKEQQDSKTIRSENNSMRTTT